MTVDELRRGVEEVIGSWIDPLGRSVTLYVDTWHDHIEADHAFLWDRPDLVQDAIERPEAIYRDATHPDRDSYYKALPDTIPRVMLKVCVEFEPPDEYQMVAGVVTTAYPAPTIKRGEMRRWP